MFYILGAVLWVLFAFWPAMVAKRKGYSFVLFFLFSLVFFVIALIVAFAISDRTLTPRDIANEKAAQRAIEKETGEDS